MYTNISFLCEISLRHSSCRQITLKVASPHCYMYQAVLFGNDFTANKNFRMSDLHTCTRLLIYFKTNLQELLPVADSFIKIIYLGVVLIYIYS